MAQSSVLGLTVGIFVASAASSAGAVTTCPATFAASPAAWAALALVAPATAHSDGAASDLPRLAGIVMAGGMHQAIFAEPGQRWTQALAEGDSIGPFNVQVIRPGEVELTSPTSRYVLTPTGDGSIRVEHQAVPFDPTADK